MNNSLVTFFNALKTVLSKKADLKYVNSLPKPDITKKEVNQLLSKKVSLSSFNIFKEDTQYDLNGKASIYDVNTLQNQVSNLQTKDISFETRIHDIEVIVLNIPDFNVIKRFTDLSFDKSLLLFEFDPAYAEYGKSFYFKTSNYQSGSKVYCNDGSETNYTVNYHKSIYSNTNNVKLAFSGITGFSTAPFDSTGDKKSLIYASIPNINQNGHSAFGGFINLKKIDFYFKFDMLLSMFTGCSSLEEIVIHDQSLYSDIPICNEHAFSLCKSLRRTPYPEMGTIKTGGFSFCKSLETVRFSNNEGMSISIEDEAFVSCESLKNVFFSSKVVSIGNSAFEDCISLTSVDLSMTTITAISNYAFRGCTSLSEIYLSNQVTNIGQYAFAGSFNKKLTIYYNGTIAQWNQITIQSGALPSHCIVVCTDGII